jgi:hypothetical protein
LAKQYESEIEQLKTLCETYQDSVHEKLRVLTRELRNDWDIIKGRRI